MSVELSKHHQVAMRKYESAPPNRVVTAPIFTPQTSQIRPTGCVILINQSTIRFEYSDHGIGGGLIVMAPTPKLAYHESLSKIIFLLLLLSCETAGGWLV